MASRSNHGRFYIILALILTVISCGGGGGGGGKSSSRSNDVIQVSSSVILENEQRQQFSFNNAAVSVSGLDRKSAVFGKGTIITGSGSVDHNNNIHIPLNNSAIEYDRLYVVEVSCWDSDKSISLCSSQNAIHVVLNGRQLKSGNWVANALTEAAYQRLAYYVALGYSESQLAKLLDSIASWLLTTAPNEATTYEHLITWSPLKNTGRTVRREEMLQTFSDTVYNHASNINLTNAVNSWVNPTESEITQAIDVNGIAFRGNHAFIAAGKDGLLVLDITNPDELSNENIISTLDITAESVAIEGNTLLVIDSESGLKAYDLNTANAPENLSSATPIYSYDAINATSLNVSEGLAYFIANNNVVVVDFRNLSSVQTLSTRPTIDEEPPISPQPHSINVHDNKLFLTALDVHETCGDLFGERTYEFDISGLKNNFIAESIIGTGKSIPGFSNSMAFSEDLFYIGLTLKGSETRMGCQFGSEHSQTSNLVLLQDQLTHFELLSHHTLAGETAYATSVVGDKVVFATGNSGLYIYQSEDLNSNQKVKPIFTISIPGGAWNIYTLEAKVFIESKTGLKILDISDIQNLNTYALTLNEPYAYEIKAVAPTNHDSLYVLEYNGHVYYDYSILHLLTLPTSSSPKHYDTIVLDYLTGLYDLDLFFSSEKDLLFHTYLSSGSPWNTPTGMNIYETSDLHTPHSLWKIEGEFDMWLPDHIFFNNNDALFSGPNKLLVLDISSINAVESIDFDSPRIAFNGISPHKMKFKGDFAYSLDNTGLHILNVGHTADQGNVQTIPVSGARELFLRDNNIYVIGDNGLYAVNYDQNSPTTPPNIEYSVSVQNTTAGYFYGDYAYISFTEGNQSKLQVIDISPNTIPTAQRKSHSLVLPSGKRIANDGHYMYFSHLNNLWVIDINDTSGTALGFPNTLGGNISSAIVSGENIALHTSVGIEILSALPQ